MDFWNSAEVGIFSELVFTSAEFRVQDSAEYWGMTPVTEGGGLGGQRVIWYALIKISTCLC